MPSRGAADKRSRESWLRGSLAGLGWCPQGPTCLMSSLQSASVDARWWVAVSNSFSGANGFDSLDVLVFVTWSPVLIVSREFESNIRSVSFGTRQQDLRKRPINLSCDEPQVDQLNLKARSGVPVADVSR